MRELFRQKLLRGGAALPWYLKMGIARADFTVIYLPKGAASLAASYINVINPGTFNAALGVAPTWDASSGWIFNGSNQVLSACPDAANLTTFIRFTDSTGALYGCASGGGYYGISSNSGTPAFWSTNNVFSGFASPGWGVLGMSGTKGYLNGNVVASGLTSPHTVSGTIKIGALDTFLAASKVQIFVAINRILSEAESMAVSQAMIAA